MAEMVMKHLVRAARKESEFFIDSAATDRDALGCPVHRGTRDALARHGVPLVAHRARLATADDYRNFDVIVCMDEENVRHLARIVGADTERKVHKLLAFCGLSRDVADPWYTGDFEGTFADVEAGCVSLLNALLRADDGLER